MDGPVAAAKMGIEVSWNGMTVLRMPTITFKVSEAEAARIRQRARAARLTVSAYLRRQATGMEDLPPVRKVRCDLTGATIFAPLEVGPKLTTADVRRMLTDFP
jgi:hypothetical protein